MIGELHGELHGDRRARRSSRFCPRSDLGVGSEHISDEDCLHCDLGSSHCQSAREHLLENLNALRNFLPGLGLSRGLVFSIQGMAAVSAEDLHSFVI